MTHEQDFLPDWFSKPGDSLRYLMQRRCIDAYKLAKNFDGGLDVLRAIFDGSAAIDKEIAKTLSSYVGGTITYWLKRQANYEAALGRALQSAESEREEWLRRVPLPGSKARNSEKNEQLRKRLAFFNVPNLEVWERRYGHLIHETKFRTSLSFTSNEDAVLIWLRKGELESELINTRPWNPDNLKDRIQAIRSLSKISQPARFLPKLKELCAEAGVALVIVKAPQGCRASGASRLVAADKAMALFSFRYRADDQFWFTVFHEIGHLLLHGAQTFLDGDRNSEGDGYEHEANQFASGCIIPSNRESEFLRLSADRDSIMRFSVSIGIAPGLTVGQMQHREMIGHDQFNSLKRRWTWDKITPVLPNLYSA